MVRHRFDDPVPTFHLMPIRIWFEPQILHMLDNQIFFILIRSSASCFVSCPCRRGVIIFNKLNSISKFSAKTLFSFSWDGNGSGSAKIKLIRPDPDPQHCWYILFSYSVVYGRRTVSKATFNFSTNYLSTWLQSSENHFIYQRHFYFLLISLVCNLDPSALKNN